MSRHLHATSRFGFDPQLQLRILDSTLAGDPEATSFVDFQSQLAACGWSDLSPTGIDVFQINLGLRCNMSCRHCHVNAGPHRTETMDLPTAQATLRALDKSAAHTVDITGGAPEIQPLFTFMVEKALERGLHVIDRCNLTVLMLEHQHGLPEWLGDRGVEIVASLPHFRARNTDALRGAGTFEQSMQGLRLLNAAGYGQGDPHRVLTLMTNPSGAFLAGDQESIQAHWKERLLATHQVRFDRLIALNNMPISRFLQWLIETGNLESYMLRLVEAFNPAAVCGLMCRNTLSVGWDGKIYDCDFNQMLSLQAESTTGKKMTVQNFHPDLFDKRLIQTAQHCFGCTAGAGSSCSGATV